ncbi:MAG: DUF3494 domain-containing protein [Geobacteraceae bacterium]|nr:DUF3494 domain-containing protein [Geobacteraceae bacterium]
MSKNILSKIWIMGLLTAVSLAGCGSDGGGAASVSAKDSGAATVGAVSTEAAAVPLGTAANYAILAKSGVKTIPTSAVTGNVGLSPAAQTYLEGWALTNDPTVTYATSAQVLGSGKLYAADNVGGTTAADLTKAVGDMETAYTAATAKPPTSAATTDLLGGTLTDQTLTAGVYQWGSALNIPTDVTISGTATDVFVFKVTGALNMAANKKVILSGGALAKNIFWQVSGAVTLGAGSHFEGIILSKTAITMQTGASINGRLLAQTRIDIDATTVKVP